MEDGTTTADGELPQGGVGWLIEENSEDDLDEDMCDVSSWDFHY